MGGQCDATGRFHVFEQLPQWMDLCPQIFQAKSAPLERGPKKPHSASIGVAPVPQILKLSVTKQAKTMQAELMERIYVLRLVCVSRCSSCASLER